ncbi:hypothetical protein E4U41_006861 [Claviceps citrina]|nr:hypothetical protein E4U41_006861 [Claviceps citrina]
MRSLFSTFPRRPDSSNSSNSPNSSPLAPSPSLPRSAYYNSWSRRTLQPELAFCDTPHLASSTTITQHASTINTNYALGCSFGDEPEEEDGDRDEYDDDDDQDDQDGQEEDDDIAVVVARKSIGSPFTTVSPLSSTWSSNFHEAMSMRNKAKRQAMDSCLNTPTTPVQIPKKSHHENAHHAKKGNPRHFSRRHYKNGHSPDAISPSVAALLAITDIPRPRWTRRCADRNRSADAVMSDQHVSEKALSLSLHRRPLDLLLSPPEDLMDDELSSTESNMGSLLARTTSADSVPSLGGESCTTEPCSSVETPKSIVFAARRRRSPMRKSLEPVRSPPDATEEHPLARVDDVELEHLELRFADEESEGDSTSFPLFQPFKPLRSVFKSNLTASLRALKSAAKSFSSINFSYIPADDLLTRSILTIDPNVPYMDERRPPVTGEMPSAELRRYLNPTTSNHFDAQPTARSAGAFSASIQLQTYKVQHFTSPPASTPRTDNPSPGHATPSPSPSASAPPSHNHSSSSGSGSSGSGSSGSGSSQQNPAKASHQVVYAPGMRQREVRENPDFIRIAVMEMAMRRRGKLDNQKPGRARWALPPRRPSAKPYEVASTGVPTRWIPVTY